MSTLSLAARLRLGQATHPDPVYFVGFWSAAVAAVASIGYSVAQVLALFGLLTFPWDAVLIFAPSLLLASAFVVMMLAIHHTATAEQRLWSHIGTVFAIMYASLVSIAYIVQLLVVIPQTLQGHGEAVALFAIRDGAVMTAIDALGYGFMSLATLFAAPVFGASRLEQGIRWLFIANGLLALPIVLAFLQPLFLLLGIWWMITIPGATILLTIHFHRLGHTHQALPAGLTAPI